MRGLGFGCNVYDDQVAARIEVVRRAKAGVGGRDLTLRELDAVIDAVDCRRSRIRDRRTAAGVRDLPNTTAAERRGS